MSVERFVHTATATATETVPSWMGSVQTNRGVHMVTDGNGNGNNILVKWVVNQFCDSNSNGKNTHKFHFSVSIAIAIHFVWTDQQRNRCHCRRSVNEPFNSLEIYMFTTFDGKASLWLKSSIFISTICTPLCCFLDTNFESEDHTGHCYSDCQHHVSSEHVPHTGVKVADRRQRFVTLFFIMPIFFPPFQ